MDPAQMTLVELCAGSAALSRRFLGFDKLVGFMGAKDRYVDQILHYWNISPNRIILNDLGFWGIIWKAISKNSHMEIADIIEEWSSWDGRELFDFLKKNKSGYLEERAANRLALLASTYGGGEIGGFKGKHKLRPSVDGFIPSRKSLVKRLRKVSEPKIPFEVHSVNALDFEPFPCFCYIDPPYANYSSYENNLGRSEVMRIARNWRQAGAKVAISESEPLDLGEGWVSQELRTSSGQVRKNSRCAKEFLTFSL